MWFLVLGCCQHHKLHINKPSQCLSRIIQVLNWYFCFLCCYVFCQLCFSLLTSQGKFFKNSRKFQRNQENLMLWSRRMKCVLISAPNCTTENTIWGFVSGYDFQGCERYRNEFQGWERYWNEKANVGNGNGTGTELVPVCRFGNENGTSSIFA